MRIRDIMTEDVMLISARASVRDAANRMAENDIGSLLVGEERNKIEGVITDRDIVTRAIARGEALDLPIGEIMSREVEHCYDDDDVRDVAQHMAELAVRRMPVFSRDDKLVGIVSLGNIAQSGNKDVQQTTLEGVAKAH